MLKCCIFVGCCHPGNFKIHRLLKFHSFIKCCLFCWMLSPRKPQLIDYCGLLCFYVRWKIANRQKSPAWFTTVVSGRFQVQKFRTSRTKHSFSELIDSLGTLLAWQLHNFKSGNMSFQNAAHWRCMEDRQVAGCTCTLVPPCSGDGCVVQVQLHRLSTVEKKRCHSNRFSCHAYCHTCLSHMSTILRENGLGPRLAATILAEQSEPWSTAASVRAFNQHTNSTPRIEASVLDFGPLSSDSLCGGRVGGWGLDFGCGFWPAH